MTESSDIAARVAELRQQIAYHNERYHTLDSPEIADADFDLLVRELLRLETEHPDLASADSPTSHVGGAPLSATFAPVVHRVPMTSLDNAMDEAELALWGERVARGLAGAPATFVCELKIDGLAMSLRYEGGKFVQAATRGDGRIGDVTANVALSPRRLSAFRRVHPMVEVRGEGVHADRQLRGPQRLLRLPGNRDSPTRATPEPEASDRRIRASPPAES